MIGLVHYYKLTGKWGISPSAGTPFYLIEEICGISVKAIHGANAGVVGVAVIAGIGAGIYADEKQQQNFCNNKR